VNQTNCLIIISGVHKISFECRVCAL